MIYDEAQEKFKNLKEEERFLFKTVKSKKRKPKQDPNVANRISMGGLTGKIFAVKKYAVPSNGSCSNKGLPSSSSSSGDEGTAKKSSNESMHSNEKEEETPKKKDYSFTQKIFNIVKRKPKEQLAESNKELVVKEAPN